MSKASHEPEVVLGPGAKGDLDHPELLEPEYEKRHMSPKERRAAAAEEAEAADGE